MHILLFMEINRWFFFASPRLDAPENESRQRGRGGGVFLYSARTRLNGSSLLNIFGGRAASLQLLSMEVDSPYQIALEQVRVVLPIGPQLHPVAVRHDFIDGALQAEPPGVVSVVP